MIFVSTCEHITQYVLYMRTTHAYTNILQSNKQVFIFWTSKIKIPDSYDSFLTMLKFKLVTMMHLLSVELCLHVYNMNLFQLMFLRVGVYHIWLLVFNIWTSINTLNSSCSFFEFSNTILTRWKWQYNDINMIFSVQSE